MPPRQAFRHHPAIEGLEARSLLAAAPTSAPWETLATQGPATVRPLEAPGPVPPLALFRITNPTPGESRLIPPFQQVLVQSAVPRTGGTYNLMFVSVRNATAFTFDASSNFQVRFSGQRQSYPILTGAQQWKPGQVIVFYVVTQKYYPAQPVTSGGFAFDLGGSRGVAIPGPSGIFLRIKYNPATIARILNYIVPFGPGAKGHELGLPDTAIWAFTQARNANGNLV